MRRVVLMVVLLAGVIAGGAAGGVTWADRYIVNQRAARPLMLLQQADGNLAIMRFDQALTPLTTDANTATRLYRYAAPAPDGSSVAFVEDVLATNGVSSTLVVQAVQGSRRSVFSSLDSHPFYLHWSPDSARIAFLTGEGRDEFVLRTVPADGSQSPQAIIPGNPSYFAWTADSRRLLLHTNGSAPQGSLSVWNLGDTEPRLLKAPPGFFRAPAWLPDGRSALATVFDGDGVALVRIGDDGVVQQRLVRTGAGLVFVPAPDGKQVAYTDMTRDQPSFLHIVGMDGQNDRAISTQDAVTFLWSPDSTRIAYLTVVRGDDIEEAAYRQEGVPKLQWHLFDMTAGTTQDLATFAPSEAFFYMLPYFDQFAQSVRLWDRSGQHLLYADDKGVWRLEVATGTTTKVSDGVLGLWMDPEPASGK